jgi:HlyD family secretion protein
VLPLAALREPLDETSATVLVAQDGRAQQRRVRLGLRTLDSVEVLQGVAEGDTVLLGGAVRPGQRVRPRLIPWRPGAAAPAATREDIGSTLGNAMGR